MLVWLAFLVTVVLVIVFFIVAAYTVISARTPEGKLDPGNFLFLFFPCIGISFVLILAICAAQVVLNDFVLPHMAIENVPFRKAWSEVRMRIAANKETFLSFFILRLAMPLILDYIGACRVASGTRGVRDSGDVRRWFQCDADGTAGAGPIS